MISKLSLKVKYFIFIFLIHVLIAVLFYYVFEEQKYYFLVAEIGIIISLWLSYSMYKSFIQPLEFLGSGANAIADKDFNVKFVKTGAKEMDHLVNVYNAMIDNIQQERIHVKEQHFFLEKLINASPAGMLILDYDDRLTEINPKANQLLQLDDHWKNKHLVDLDNELLNEIAKVDIGQSTVISLHGMDQYKCEVSHFIHKGFQRKFILIQELSREILEAEKRAYGKVIRMMAHEVNNSIGAINSIMQSTVDYIEDDVKDFDEDIKTSLAIAIDRNKNLNKFMANFADIIRLPEPTFETIELNQLVKKIATLMEPKAQKNQINFVYELVKEELRCRADEQQLEQVLVNILKNSIEAIDEKGTIKFVTKSYPHTIIIADNGIGISKDIAEKLFTPFFSTKADGQGLGLTLIREILSNHNTQFSLETKNGWTSFIIVFV